MPAPIDPNLKAQIRRAYVNSRLSPQELADKFGVSDRSVQNWAKAENWDAERTAEKVIEFARQPRSERPSIRGVIDPSNAIAIADLAIKDLQVLLIDSDMSGKDKAAISNSLRQWLEYREKLQPKTAADLADQVIALGIPISEFVRELKERWQSA
jgi:hypothetical protein